MDKLFDNFYNYKGFGPSISPAIPADELCNSFQNTVPDQLISYWKEHGFSGWGEGIFWLVNPLEYKSILDAWLEGTPFEDKDEYSVIARTAFGSLFVWGKNTGASIDIHSPWGMLFPNDQSNKLAKFGPDKLIQGFFASQSKDYCDLTDENNQPLFQKAKEKLGPLSHNEMYAFVPALALGGKADIKFLQKVSIFEHLALLADLGEKRIMADVNQALDE